MKTIISIINIIGIQSATISTWLNQTLFAIVFIYLSPTYSLL